MNNPNLRMQIVQRQQNPPQRYLEQRKVEWLRIQPHNLKKSHVHRLQDKTSMFSNMSLELE